MLLPFYSVSETDVRDSERGQPHAGMDAPPPPLLESHARPAPFSSPERRPLGMLPVGSRLQSVTQLWHTTLLLIGVTEVRYTDLAMLQQWRLEGG